MITHPCNCNQDIVGQLGQACKADDEESNAIRKVTDRAVRLAKCGSKGRALNPETGRKDKPITMYCGLAECDWCGPYHIKLTQKALISGALEHGGLYLIDTDGLGKKDISALINGAGITAVDYGRLPGNSGGPISEALFVTGDAVRRIKESRPETRTFSVGEITIESIIDWRQYAWAPPNRRRSGHLVSIESKSADAEETISVKREVLVVEDLPEHQIDEIYEQAYKQTIELAPSTPEELQEAINIRDGRVRVLIENRGGRIVYSRHDYVRARIARIKWVDSAKIFSVDPLERLLSWGAELVLT